ncbi:hypothetical protein D3C81_2227380 [compost metagenome]
MDYVHPSWLGDGEAVGELDLCYLSYEEADALPGALVARFLKTYYAILPNKPAAWNAMVEKAEERKQIKLLPI